MLFLFSLVPALVIGSQFTDAVGLILAVAVVEIAREWRGYQRGRRLREVETKITECLVNHPKRKTRKTQPLDSADSFQGSNKKP